MISGQPTVVDLNSKAKRLRAFKQQMREQLDRVIDPVDASEVEDP